MSRDTALIVPFPVSEWLKNHHEQIEKFAYAGGLKTASEIVSHIDPDALVCDENGPCVGREAFVFRVPDNRMFPVFREGDLITFTPATGATIEGTPGAVVLIYDFYRGMGEFAPGIVLDDGQAGLVVKTSWPKEVPFPVDDKSEGIVAVAVDFQSAGGGQ